MKIAVINEVSASLRNEDIMKALHKTTDAEILLLTSIPVIWQQFF